MSESRLTLELHEEWETDREHEVELASNIDLDASTELTGLAWVGIIALVSGVAMMLVSGLLFIIGYPDKWYAQAGYTFAQSASHVRMVVTLFGMGMVGLFLGSSFFFFGRRSTGQGVSPRMLMEAT
jgi:hypothetical protein